MPSPLEEVTQTEVEEDILTAAVTEEEAPALTQLADVAFISSSLVQVQVQLLVLLVRFVVDMVTLQ